MTPNTMPQLQLTISILRMSIAIPISECANMPSSQLVLPSSVFTRVLSGVLTMVISGAYRWGRV